MPKVSEVFGGAYLKAEQYLNGKPRVITIDGYNIETIFGKEEYVLYLVGEKKGMRLTMTCANDIAEILGDDMEKWSGQSIELYPEQKTRIDKETQIETPYTMFRARAPSGSATKLPTPTPPQSTPPKSLPDIPF
jgi:hypothetical protein